MILPFLTSAIDLLMGTILKASATKRLQRAAKSTEPLQPPPPIGMGTTAAYMQGRTDEQIKGQTQEHTEQMTGDARDKLGAPPKEPGA
ncbi:MAG TPA: hypothetical protein VGO53_16255 [Steroidobacteraceae bacterium]|jgi:hypothetical protein|nr:hypothetical protein [Steroidobacteraceae bacterium]